MTKKGKRNPFPRPSLPQAGESLGDTAFDLFYDRFLFFFVMGWAFIIVAAVDWGTLLWTGERVTPWVWTFFAAALLTMATYRWFRIKPQLDALWQGRRGERQVGRMLEELRELGYKVFHDIPGEGTGAPFNIDHVLIGPAGVFAIETKTLSMPGDRKAEGHYDGTRVLIDGRAPDRDPVAQVRANADYLRDILKRMTGRDVSVRGVVLFPGWYVHQPATCDTWVLNPKKMLRAMLEREPRRLPPEDVALYADRLTLKLSEE